MGGIGHFSLASGCGGDGETGHGLGFGDMAVLFRIGRQAEEIASALGRRGIPYQQVGVTPFYLTPEVRHVHDLIHVSAGSAVMADGLRSPQDHRLEGSPEEIAGKTARLASIGHCIPEGGRCASSMTKIAMSPSGRSARLSPAGKK
jgi:hypothetical protein